MCIWSISISLWLSFPPPLPFHFLITGPLPSITGAQSRLSLRYSIFCSVPHFLAVLRHDPHGSRKWAFATLISHSLTPSLAPCRLLTLYVSRPHPSLKCTHLEQVTDHLKHLECGEAITLPSSHLQRPCHCSVLVFEWTLVYNHYSSHSRSHHSAYSVSPRLTSQLRLAWNNTYCIS